MICQVQAINDSPFTLYLELIVLEKSYHFSLHCKTLMIKQNECFIIMKIHKINAINMWKNLKSNGEFEIVESEDHLVNPQ